MAYRPQARQDGLITQELGDELMVYDVESNEAHCLNAAAAQVWQRCDGETTVEDLAAALDGETDPGSGADVVRHALDQLAAARLLEEESADELAPSGITRRQLVHRVGIAAAVALPLVTSIVAPTAAEAQTMGETGPTGPTGITGPTGPPG